MEIYGIPVIIEYDEDGTIIITDDIINMYGVGDTITEAIKDYKDTIKEYYKDLKENEGMLGHNLRQHLEYLRDSQPELEFSLAGG